MILCSDSIKIHSLRGKRKVEFETEHQGTIHMGTTPTRRPVTDTILSLSMRSMSFVWIHMLKVLVQEPLGSVLPLKDTLYRYVRHTHTEYEEAEHISNCPQVTEAKTMTVPGDH